MACNTSNIKEMKYGRPQTVMFTGQPNKPNGIIVTLGDTMEGAPQNDRSLDHVHKIEVADLSASEVIGKWIVIAPEINVEQYRRINDRLDNFELEADTTYTAYQLQKYDRIEYTEDYFEAPGTVNVGEFINIAVSGEFTKTGANNAQDSAFRVVSIVDTHVPFVLAPNTAPDQAGSLLPKATKKIKLEVVR